MLRKIGMSALLALLATGCLMTIQTRIAAAKVDIAELYINALLDSNVQELEKLLAPNFWYIGANGHIHDKENFIGEIRSRAMRVERLKFFNVRETKVGDTRLLTANGTFKGVTPIPGPEGLMRYTMAIADNHGTEQVAMFQITPVIASRDCIDGNCRIK